MFGDVLFLSTEPGARATTSFIQDVPDWATMVAIVEQLKLVK